MDVEQLIDRATGALTVQRVFGEPYEHDGMTTIPLVPGARRQPTGAGWSDGRARWDALVAQHREATAEAQQVVTHEASRYVLLLHQTRCSFIIRPPSDRVHRTVFGTHGRGVDGRERHELGIGCSSRAAARRQRVCSFARAMAVTSTRAVSSGTGRTACRLRSCRCRRHPRSRGSPRLQSPGFSLSSVSSRERKRSALAKNSGVSNPYTSRPASVRPNGSWSTGTHPSRFPQLARGVDAVTHATGDGTTGHDAVAVPDERDAARRR